MKYFWTKDPHRESTALSDDSLRFEALKFSRITKEQLLALLKESLGKEGTERLNPKSSFEKAFSRTMSLLNAAKYDFSNYH